MERTGSSFWAWSKIGNVRIESNGRKKFSNVLHWAKKDGSKNGINWVEVGLIGIWVIALVLLNLVTLEEEFVIIVKTSLDKWTSLKFWFCISERRVWSSWDAFEFCWGLRLITGSSVSNESDSFKTGFSWSKVVILFFIGFLYLL